MIAESKPPRSVGKGTQAGFTLLELLIAFTLLALILTALTGALRFAGRAWESGEARAESKADFRQATSQFRRQLSRSLPMVWGLDKDADLDFEEPRHAFAGTARQLRFAVVEPAYPSDPGVYLITFDITEQQGEQVLRYYRSIYRAEMMDFDAVPLNDEEGVVLLRGEFDIGFSYADDESETGEADWRETWSDPRQRPQLVRFAINQAGEDRPAWPQAIVRLMVDTEFDCLEPLNSGICSLDE